MTQSWLDALVSSEVRSPISKQAEDSSATPPQADEVLADTLDAEVARPEDQAVVATMSEEQIASAAEAFRTLLATSGDDITSIQTKLQQMYPDMTPADFEAIKERHWDPYFSGLDKVTTDTEGCSHAGRKELAEMVDATAEYVLAHPYSRNKQVIAAAFLASEYSVTEPILRSELVRRAIGQDPLDHRDPNEKYRDTHLQQTGPYTGEPGMQPMAKDLPEAPPLRSELPAPSTEPPQVDEMVKRRVQLKEKLDAMEDQLASIRSEMTKDLLPLTTQVEAEQGLIVDALKKIDGMQMVVDNWKAFLKTRASYTKLNKAKLLDKITEVAKAESERIYKLIRQLSETKAYKTEVPESQELKVERVKEAKMYGEDLILTQAEKGWAAKLFSWFKRTFLPSLEEAVAGMEELNDYLEAAQSSNLELERIPTNV